MAAEKRLQNQILREFGSVTWCRLWRQNTGSLRADGDELARVLGKLLNAPGLHAGIVTEARSLLSRTRRVAFGVPGCADLSGVLLGGARLEIECKGPRGAWGKNQRAFAAMIESLDGIYVLARSIDDVRRALEPYARLYRGRAPPAPSARL